MNVNSSFLILAIIFVEAIANSQSFEWAKQTGGTSTDIGRSITVDAAGNVYSVGYFQGSVDFDPGPGNAILNSSGDNDIFIQKMDANGNYIWAKSMGGTLDDRGYSITVDPSGSIYTTGYFRDNVDFDPGTGTDNLIALGETDVFIQKLDSSGNFIWARQMGGLSFDAGYSIVEDGSGNIYTVGYFWGVADFNPGGGILYLTSDGFSDVFVQKLDTSGNFIWAKRIGGTNEVFGNSVSVDGSGNVYTIGDFKGTVDFDPSAGTENLTSNGFEDIFIQKMTASGNLSWVKQMGGIDTDEGRSIKIDPLGNVYSTGFFLDIVDFDPGTGSADLNGGSGDIYVLKLDPNGNYIWAKRMGGAASDFGYSIAVDASGNAYTTGFFQGSADFDPGTGTANLTNGGMFIQKLDSSGNYLWATQPTQLVGTGGVYGYSITVGISGFIYTCGSFRDSADFDPSPGSAILSVVGDQDSFVLKLGSTATSIAENNLVKKFNLFPNPTAGNFSIDLGTYYEKISLSIMDISGKLISKSLYYQSQRIDTSLRTSAGLYVIHVSCDNIHGTLRLIKE